MLNYIAATAFNQKDLTTAIIHDPIIGSPEMTVREAIARMGGARSQRDSTAQTEPHFVQLEARASCVVVVESQKVVGILTERDIVRLCADQQLLDEIPVSQVMTASVLTLRESAFTDLVFAINWLQHNRIRHLPIVDEQDCLVGIVTHETLLQVLQPITLLQECQQVEANLQESEQQYAKLAALAPVGIFHADAGGNCTYVNDRWCQIAGLTLEQATGKGWIQALHPDDRDAVVMAWDAAVQAGSRAQLEYRYLRADGTVTWVFWQLEHEMDTQGNVIGYVGTITDITDRKSAKRANQRLQEAQRIAHLGNWELDLQHNDLYWSEEVFRIFEINSLQFGASYEAFLDLVHPEDQSIVSDAYSQHLRDRQPYNLVHRLQMPDGRIKYVLERCETTFSANGTPLLSRGTVQDITQQREAEIHRDRAEASLRQVIEGTAAFTGEAYFPAMVRHIAEALGVRYVSVSQATSEGFQVLAFFADGELCPPPFLPYDLVPCCHQALQTGSCCHPAGIHALYPDNPLFTDLQIDSYLGVGLRNAAGEPTGNLCILHDAPLTDPEWAQTLLSIFAARAGAELERLLTAQALAQLNAELEDRVAQRTIELAERETLLQDFLENANDLIQIVDIDTGHFKFVNQAWCDALGYTAAEVEQLNCFDVLAPDCHPHCQAIFAQMQLGSLTALEQVELIFVSKSGQRVVVEGNVNCRIEIQSDGRQRAVSTRGIFRDITARKETQQELQRREARYRGLMEGAADAILLADLQGNIVEANQKAEVLLGYPLAELTTLHFSQLHPDEALPRARTHFAEIVQQQRCQVLDEIFQRPDGTTVSVDITATVIDLDGEILVQGIFRDISERKAIEQALQEAQQFLQTVLDTVPLAVFWKDRDSNYLGANQRFLRDAALSSVSELVGKTDFAMPWGATEAETYRADDRTVIENGKAKLGIIETLHRQNGTEVWLETNKLPLRNWSGEVIGVLGTYQDQ